MAYLLFYDRGERKRFPRAFITGVCFGEMETLRIYWLFFLEGENLYRVKRVVQSTEVT
jgi:hypothetical protein